MYLVLSVFFFCWTCFTCIFHVLFFYVLKNGFSSFRIFYFPVVMYLKKMLFFIQQIGEDIFCFFSSCHFSFFFCSLVFFFFEKSVCEIILFIFELFLRFLNNPFPPYFLTKNQLQNIHFSFSSLFFCFTFFLSTFFLVSIIIFSLIIFPSCVFLLAWSFFLVCPMFFVLKNKKFVFEKNSKKSLTLSLKHLFWKTLFLIFYHFSPSNCFFMHDLQKHFAILPVFSNSFLKK